MAADVNRVVEEFLVEHVMIGLGNIRLALDGLGGDGLAGTPAQTIAVARIGAQIDHLETRARVLHGLLRLPPGAPCAAAGRPAPVIFQSRRGVN